MLREKLMFIRVLQALIASFGGFISNFIVLKYVKILIVIDVYRTHYRMKIDIY